MAGEDAPRSPVPAGRFFDRVRADLAASRRLRLAERAIERGYLTQARRDEILRQAAPERPLEEALVALGGLSPAQVEELVRAVDGEVPSRRDPAAPRYEAGEKLGEGAVSIVYRGVDRELGRPVALKFLRESLSSQAKVRERFSREAQSLARMDHPHVVKVHDVVRDGDRLFLVMELIEGEPLSRTLQRESRASRDVLALLEQAARGIQHAHERGIVHRDLKPDNILVAPGGGAKVADFGLAHVAETGPALTHTGTVLGTPLYMAPEQVRGRSEVTARTDVYALGAILYQTLTGRPPHEAETLTQVYDKILHEDPLSPRSLDPRLPWELEAVALKAMEKEPARRYATAGAFAEELRRFLSGEPVEARPVPTVLRAWRRIARTRGLAAGLLSALLLAGILAAAWMHGRSRLQGILSEARAHERERRTHQARDGFLRALGVDGSSAEARAGADRTSEALQRASSLLEASRPLLEKAYAASYDARIELDTLRSSVEAARGLIEQALARAADLALAHYRRAEVWEIQGYYGEAAADFRRAAELDPRSGPARYRLGRILLWQAYLASLNMWTVPDPADRERGERLAREGLREIEASRAEGSGFDDDLRRDVAAAMLAYLRGQKDEVRRLCAEAIRRFGSKEGAEEFHWLHGLVEADRAAATRSYDVALSIRPRFPLALYSRAWARGGAGGDFDQAIRCAPGFAEAYIFRGSHFLAEPSNLQRAVADFEVLIRRGLYLAPAYNGRGAARLKLGDYDGALADLTEAIRLKPEGYHIPWALRAEARLAQGDAKGAVSDATRALEILGTGEGRERSLVARGRARALLGDRAAAMADLKSAGSSGAPFLKKLEEDSPGPRTPPR